LGGAGNAVPEGRTARADSLLRSGAFSLLKGREQVAGGIANGPFRLLPRFSKSVAIGAKADIAQTSSIGRK
jgi:hypothetical protein